MTSKKRSKRKDKASKRKNKKLTASDADKYELYQWSVQSPKGDIEFLSDVYKKMNHRDAVHFREDFCGTGLLSATWIAQGDRFTAEGFDIDPEPVDWGKARHFAELGDAAERMTFHLADVRQPSTNSPDVRCAQNFSYWVFKTRREMLEYFSGVREDLAPDGIFVIDLYGGPEIFEHMKEEAEIHQGFTYVWHQSKYWPVTSEAILHIHFKFPDGSKMKRAFTYDWRIWGLTELQDLMRDAGFSSVDCYWEGTAKDGISGNGEFTLETRGERCLSYVAYLVAQK